MEREVPATHDSSLLLSRIVQMANIVREMIVEEKPLQSLFLYSLVHHSSALFKTIWTTKDYLTLLSYVRKPTLFLIMESELTTVEWLEWVRIILRSPIAAQLIQQCNREYTEHNEDGFVFELLWALHVKKVNTESRLEIITMCLNLGLNVSALDINYCLELYGCGVELDMFIFSVKRELLNEHMCEFPITTFLFGWADEINKQTLLGLFKNLMEYDVFVTPRSKRHYIMLSLRFFAMSVQTKQQLEDWAKVHVSGYAEVIAAISLVPVVPSLREICRNALYKHMRPNVKTVMDFSRELERVGLPRVVADLVMFKRPIY